VVVVCNLKETKLQGFMSFGMVLCSKVGDTKMVLLEPPAGATVGERVFVDGLRVGEVGGGPPLAAARVKKLKVWEAVAPDLATDAAGVACWKGRPLVVDAGPVVAPGAPSAAIL